MISIVIIGKNEAKNLPKLYSSLEALSIEKELIYIDSASSDNSVNISKNYCDGVYEIEDSPYLCAAAGRYLGTQKAKYDWLLYLDGDMELEEEFREFLNSRSFLNYSADIAGFIGYYDYIYADETNDANRLLQVANQEVDHFGGAVMLKKSIVLQAANWNPSVVANEEIDLYMRIQALGYRVFGLDKKMVKHIAKKESNLKTLLSLFIPQNRRYYGFGQVLVSQYKHKTLLPFLVKRAYPLLFLLLLTLAPFFKGSLIALLLLMLFITIRKRWYYNLIYLSEIFRGVFGIFSYREYKPKFQRSKP